jgi:hypothetical protein
MEIGGPFWVGLNGSSRIQNHTWSYSYFPVRCGPQNRTPVSRLYHRKSVMLETGAAQVKKMLDSMRV